MMTNYSTTDKYTLVSKFIILNSSIEKPYYAGGDTMPTISLEQDIEVTC